MAKDWIALSLVLLAMTNMHEARDGEGLDCFVAHAPRNDEHEARDGEGLDCFVAHAPRNDEFESAQKTYCRNQLIGLIGAPLRRTSK